MTLLSLRVLGAPWVECRPSVLKFKGSNLIVDSENFLKHSILGFKKKTKFSIFVKMIVN